MSDHTTPKPEDAGADAPVEFTASEHKQLCEVVGAAVSDLLGMPVRVGFAPEDAAFLIEITGTVPEAFKN